MDKLSEGINKDESEKLNQGIEKLKDFFTLEDNKIKCDYCTNSYDIILNTEEVRKHLKEEHKEYANAVSPKSSQEDFEKYYRTENNFIECVRCNKKLCDPWNTRSIVHFHLEVGHQFGEGETNFFWLWIRRNYTLEESDAKQHCKKCNAIIINKPTFLIKHLSDFHNDEGSNYIPKGLRNNGLDTLLEHWIWHYFTKYKENARCFYGCGTDLKLYHSASYQPIKKHIDSYHKKDKLDTNKRYYTEIQEHLVKCDFCKKDYDISFGVSVGLQRHLENVHRIKLNEWIHNNLSHYRSTYFKKLGFEKYQCNKCNEVLKACTLKLTEHLETCQKINIPTEISSMGKSSSLLSSDGNVKDVGTSSGEPQSGSSKYLDIDVGDRDSGLKNVKYDDDKCSRDELPRTSSNILDDTEGIAGSNIDQQSARDQFSNTRLPSSSSDPANSAVLNIGDEFDLDQIDNFPKIDKQDSDLNLDTIDTKKK